MEASLPQPKQQFVRVNDEVLINASRLMAMRYKPVGQYGSTKDHYLAAFDTGQQVVLTPEEGRQLLTQIIAMTSESAT
ncbi:MAG TPA: hypothetical protein VKC61_17330 [Pyrinomonadaceae bacterium]|nr:hypothetical protein [Pyrinomonadaceae bacterium]